MGKVLLERCRNHPFEITISGLPPTANTMWRNGRHGVYLSKEAVAFKNLVGMLTKKAAIKLYDTFDLSPLKGQAIRFEMRVYKPSWKLKTVFGIQRPDLDNLLKATIDGIFPVLNLNDASVTEIHASKEDCLLQESEHTWCQMIFL